VSVQKSLIETLFPYLEAFTNAQRNAHAADKATSDMTGKQRKSLVELFAQLLRPYGRPPTPLHEVLYEAAGRAGWTPPSAKALARQQTAARGRNSQREEDMAHRRVLVGYLFKQLGRGLRAKPASLGTAQAIIGRLDDLPFYRKPPMTVRTIQADIKFMRENGNFGI
jgi:hypothetical protein